MLEHCLPSVERATIPAASHELEFENPQAYELIRAQMASRLAEPLLKSGRGRAEDLDLGSASCQKPRSCLSTPRSNLLRAQASEGEDLGVGVRRSPLFTGRGAGPKKGPPPLTERGGNDVLAELIAMPQFLIENTRK
jgi:hypothetical protein